MKVIYKETETGWMMLLEVEPERLFRLATALSDHKRVGSNSLIITLILYSNMFICEGQKQHSLY